ncbi:hypothetical protein [Salmonella enterica]|uniref:hypothetical protein n=1 Tax=Salmonella enterica TaxID=28901 RepID=UPI003F8BD7F2
MAEAQVALDTSSDRSNHYSRPVFKQVLKVVTNGAIVIHTQRLKSDPGGNLLS